MQQGITFEVSGSDGQRRDRAWPLDLVPRVLTATEWTTIKRGLAQRIRALNAFVDDVYHAHEIVRAGIVPWSLVVSRPSFARPVHGVRAPGGVYCHVSGCDLVRGGDQRWRVLEDNVRTPSGISYVLENRLAMTRLMPELFAGHRIRAVDHYPSLLLDALRAVAPAADGNPNVVLWTPGPLNSAYFEHAFLARQMGDRAGRGHRSRRARRGLLHAHDGRAAARARDLPPARRRLHRPARVPPRLAARASPGWSGPIAPAPWRSPTRSAPASPTTRRSTTTCPEMIHFYLGEEPILDNVPTYLLTDEKARRHVLGRLAELVVKPTSESGGKGVFIGPHATAAELEQQARLIEAQPDRFIAQELVHLSTAPTETGDGRLAPRHVDLRPFAVFGDEIRIVPGGLTRVALREGSMIVNSSQGGGSKDTWVLDDGEVGDLAPGTLPAHRPPRLPDVRYGGWHGQAQQQQQQPLRDAFADTFSRR